MELPETGRTLAEICKAADDHSKKMEMEYKRKGHDKQQINFCDKPYEIMVKQSP